MTETQVTESFRLAYVPGVTPGKWGRTWETRLPEVPLELLAVEADRAEPALLAEEAEAALVRLPVDRERLHAIPLYTETTVAVVPKDHWLAAAEEVEVGDLAEEVALHPLDDVLGWDALPGIPARERPATTRDAVELVAAGIGVLLVPQSLARLHHRRDLTYRPLAGQGEEDPGGSVARSQVALAWRQDRGTDLVEEFIGIVRGRTVNSSRGRGSGGAWQPAEPKKKPAKAATSGKAAKSAQPGRGGKPAPKQQQKQPRRGAAGRPQRRGKR